MGMLSAEVVKRRQSIGPPMYCMKTSTSLGEVKGMDGWARSDGTRKDSLEKMHPTPKPSWIELQHDTTCPELHVGVGVLLRGARLGRAEAVMAMERRPKRVLVCILAAVVRIFEGFGIWELRSGRVLFGWLLG